MLSLRWKPNLFIAKGWILLTQQLICVKPGNNHNTSLENFLILSSSVQLKVSPIHSRQKKSSSRIRRENYFLSFSSRGNFLAPSSGNRKLLPHSVCSKERLDRALKQKIQYSTTAVCVLHTIYVLLLCRSSFYNIGIEKYPGWKLLFLLNCFNYPPPRMRKKHGWISPNTTWIYDIKLAFPP